MNPVVDFDKVLYFYCEDNFSNPETVAFWEEKIYQFCVQSFSLSFEEESFIQKNVFNDVYPSSFTLTLHNVMVKNKFVVDRSELLVNSSDEVNSLFQSLSIWAGEILSTNPVKNQKAFMCMKLLNKVCTILMHYVSTLHETDAVVFRSHDSHPKFSFHSLFCGAASTTDETILSEHDNKVLQFLKKISKEDTDVVQQHLIKTGCAKVSGDGSILKIHQPSRASQSKETTRSIFASWSFGTNNVNSMVLPDSDEAKLRLKNSVYLVECKVESLNEKIAVAIRKAKEFKVSDLK
jgi:hypothetical protein